LFFSGFGVPVAFAVTRKKDAETYEEFFRIVLKASKGKWTPSFLICDFESLFSSSFFT